MPEDWHPEALRAQAVVARSYALATLKPGTLFDLYADTRSQVYGGVRAEEPTTNRAIGSTAGKVLFWNGRVATTFYHSTSGGRTVSIAEAWPRATPVPYLVSVADPHDTLSKHHRWGPFRLTPAEVAQELGSGGVRDLLVDRGPSGRVVDVRLKVGSGVRQIEPQDFRRALDLRSTWFNVRVLNLDPPLRPRAREQAGEAARVRPRARQGPARAAGERRCLDDRQAREDAAGRPLHGHRHRRADDELPAGDAGRSQAARSPSSRVEGSLDPVGRAPLEECAQALLAFRARAPLGDPARRLGAVRPVEDEPFRVASSPRAGAAQLGEDPLDRGVQVRVDLVDEPDPERSLGVEPLAGDEVAAGGARSRSSRARTARSRPG